MRFWLLTSTFYGNWLPGDPRGFVGRVRDVRVGEAARTARREHDRFGDQFDHSIPGLMRSAQTRMSQSRVRITRLQAETLELQFRESADHKLWRLLAIAIMADHVHWAVGLHDAEAGRVGLQVFKAYGSRRLNQHWPQSPVRKWWTSKGSARLLPDETAVRSAVRYVVEKQSTPLCTWRDAIYSAD